MGTGRTSKRKKKNSLKSMLIVMTILILVILAYYMYSKLILPFWQEYQEKKAALEKVTLPEKVEEEKVEIIPEEELKEITLYFADNQANFLVPEKRLVSVSSTLAKQMILELIKGPQTEGLYPTLPEGTKLSELYIAENIAYVDLSEEVIKNHPGGSAAEIMSIYSIVNTLTEIDSIQAVQILVAGQERKSLTGHLDISRPLLRDEEWIKPQTVP
ncbi:MAG: hypothetical protein Kow00103_14130 [Candidatus Caldatribacteriota bacterium]